MNFPTDATFLPVGTANQYLARYSSPMGLNTSPWANKHEPATYRSALSGPGYGLHWTSPGLARIMIISRSGLRIQEPQIKKSCEGVSRRSDLSKI